MVYYYISWKEFERILYYILSRNSAWVFFLNLFSVKTLFWRNVYSYIPTNIPPPQLEVDLSKKWGGGWPRNFISWVYIWTKIVVLKVEVGDSTPRKFDPAPPQGCKSWFFRFLVLFGFFKNQKKAKNLGFFGFLNFSNKYYSKYKPNCSQFI